MNITVTQISKTNWNLEGDSSIEISASYYKGYQGDLSSLQTQQSLSSLNNQLSRCDRNIKDLHEVGLLVPSMQLNFWGLSSGWYSCVHQHPEES